MAQFWPKPEKPEKVRIHKPLGNAAGLAAIWHGI
jgi:hypothetical protein